MGFNADAAIQNIAKREGRTEDEVLACMQEALEEGMNNPDPAIRAAWQLVPHRGEAPTPQEVMGYIVNKLKSGQI